MTFCQAWHTAWSGKTCLACCLARQKLPVLLPCQAKVACFAALPGKSCLFGCLARQKLPDMLPCQAKTAYHTAWQGTRLPGMVPCKFRICLSILIFLTLSQYARQCQAVPGRGFCLARQKVPDMLPGKAKHVSQF
jgi:hypothetical protein